MLNILGKKLLGIAEKTADEIEGLDFMKTGGDRVRPENLAPVLSWIQKQR
jgi:hypothetical protein